MYTMINEETIHLASTGTPCGVALDTSMQFHNTRFTKEMFAAQRSAEYFEELLERGWIVKCFMNFDTLQEVSPEPLTIAQMAAIEEMIEDALLQNRNAAA